MLNVVCASCKATVRSGDAGTHQGAVTSQYGQLWETRTTEELNEIGLDIGHRRVRRWMRQNGISVVRTRKYKATTADDHKFNNAPNLLDRDFNADAPNQKWAGDISYIWTRERWLYLAVILNLHSRRVIG